MEIGFGLVHKFLQEMHWNSLTLTSFDGFTPNRKDDAFLMLLTMSMKMNARHVEGVDSISTLLAGAELGQENNAFLSDDVFYDDEFDLML